MKNDRIKTLCKNCITAFCYWSKSMELFKLSLKEYAIFLVIKVTLKISLPRTQE